VSLGHQRLSVIDLSNAGNQPMHSESDRYCLVYNGEIYNAERLREELAVEGTRFRGSSDTEVVLELCARYPIDAAVKKLIGMFAFGLWDKQEKVLYLVRDRLGIKPLYYYHHAGLFLFASEIRSFHHHPGCNLQIDRHALKTFMQFGYIKAPETIYKNVFKLEPGTVLKLDGSGQVSTQKYWDFDEIVSATPLSDTLHDETEQIQSLEALLNDAVKSRLVSDVPLGAFLSGGIDSSLVVALMQKNNTSRVKTFSIGFDDKKFNEADYAKQVASQLNTDHSEFYISAPELLDTIPLIPGIYDEPFADPSQIPTYLVSKITREHVTVALSGDGGDEVFAGYKRYRSAKQLNDVYGYLTPIGRGMLQALIRGISNGQWNKLLETFHVRHAGDKLYQLADLLSDSKSELYSHLVSHWYHPDQLVLDDHQDDQYSNRLIANRNLSGLIEQMQYIDTAGYLTDDILTKVDRASMAVSLETRVPILDHRVVEMAWQLPLSMKYRHGQGKWVLRQILNQYLPEELINRTKMGFSVPLASWLRGPLREWSEALIEKSRLDSEGYLNSTIVHEKWQQHQRGERNWQNQIWNVLMFQAWHERWS
ncbi:MAG: asparagine synthase (glutamine-hydrolyzing), partial [Gammaproteobacteria bacterium]|nr:asparagine synthase (glutamine-hydrolyzing) [Gammaproteobacteria bacterium]